jgi:hypothetical protein
MKTFRKLIETTYLNEGHDRYPGDDMTQKELKIAINSARNILEMLEDGASLMRWQISAIVKASDELASVCTSMRADEEDDDEWIEYDEYDMPSDYDHYSMYGESITLEETNIGDFRRTLIQRAIEDYTEGKDVIRGVSVDKIVSAFTSKNNFGSKAQDELESELNLPIGVIKSITKEVQSELKRNMSASKATQTQAQRVDRYLKQKWVK